MISPSQLAAAQQAGDRRSRTRHMAEVMRATEAAHGACTLSDLRAAGFTGAECFAYADEARAILSGRPGAGRERVSPARREAAALVAKAVAIRKRQRA